MEYQQPTGRLGVLEFLVFVVVFNILWVALAALFLVAVVLLTIPLN